MPFVAGKKAKSPWRHAYPFTKPPKAVQAPTPRESWWVGKTRAEFADQLSKEIGRMNPVGPVYRPPVEHGE